MSIDPQIRCPKGRPCNMYQHGHMGELSQSANRLISGCIRTYSSMAAYRQIQSSLVKFYRYIANLYNKYIILNEKTFIEWNDQNMIA